jgi:hypothetical protein
MRAQNCIIICAIVLLSCEAQKRALPTPSEVLAKRVSQLPLDDPLSPLWSEVPEHTEKLLLQDQTDPKQTSVSIPEIRIRAMHDGSWLAVRLEWEDSTKDVMTDVNRFSDGVALQFPMNAGGDVPDAAMGLKGKPVRIHHWKASREAFGKGEDPLKALYPNARIDHYPFEAAPNDAERDQMVLRYSPARALGNPVASISGPVVDLWAEGFGTLTADTRSISKGHGVYEGGRWFVVISRPLDSSPTDALRPGNRTYMAVAVWDGSHGDVGSRKMRSGWIPFEIE